MATTQNQFILTAHADFCPAVIREALHSRIDDICLELEQIACQQEPERLFKIERKLKPLVYALGALLIQFYLALIHERLDNSSLRWPGKIRRRQIYTFFGRVVFWRRNKHGASELDCLLGISRGLFSLYLSQWFARQSALHSYELAARMFLMDHDGAPSIPSIRKMALGYAQYASDYMADPRFTPKKASIAPGQRSILQVQVDGKGFPTLREEELTKRRAKAARTREQRIEEQEGCQCCATGHTGTSRCSRHRNRESRAENPKSRKKRGDKSKNARSATLGVISQLIEGEDGKLHGPFLKRAWGSLGPRKNTLEWLRQEVRRRGFNPDGSDIQVLFDGERCLELEIKRLFPNAVWTLDVRHAQEYLWCAGRQFHKEGSEELKDWVKVHLELVCEGNTTEAARRIRISMAMRCKEDAKEPLSEKQCQIVETALNYLEKRQLYTEYTRFKKNDLDIGTGQVEGAARSYVGQRLDMGGMRWSERGGQSILHLRCIELNGEFEKFVDYVEERINQEWLKKEGPPILLSNRGARLHP